MQTDSLGREFQPHTFAKQDGDHTIQISKVAWLKFLGHVETPRHLRREIWLRNLNLQSKFTTVGYDMCHISLSQLVVMWTFIGLCKTSESSHFNDNYSILIGQHPATFYALETLIGHTNHGKRTTK